MIISKSDYLKYYQCPKCLWLYKKRKDLLPADLEEQMAGAVSNGQTVEDEAVKLFPEGVRVPNGGFQAVVDATTAMILDRTPVLFQASFWENELYCRADIIKHDPVDDTWDNYEVKSATQVKKEYYHDLAFQKICMAEAGLKVKRSFVIRVNNEYVRQGEVKPEELLVIEEVTAEVDGLIDEVRENIEKAKILVNQREESKVRILKQCHNPYACMFIDYCWQAVPEHSVYNVYPSEEQLNRLLDEGIVNLADMPEEMIGKEKYRKYYQACKQDKVLIDQAAIKNELAKYQYPLYFFDYETNGNAVPMFNGYRPYQQIPFQYSLHVLDRPDGELKHFEYLADKAEDPVPGLAKALSEQIGPAGSVVVWYKGFETARNDEMALRCPEFAGFFSSINERIIDLMDFFAEGYYVDKNFFGSASLKKVLPVIAPHLSYKSLNIQEGALASASWPILIGGNLLSGEFKELREDMLKYCELDTFAMVEIFRILLGFSK